VARTKRLTKNTRWHPATPHQKTQPEAAFFNKRRLAPKLTLPSVPCKAAANASASKLSSWVTTTLPLLIFTHLTPGTFIPASFSLSALSAVRPLAW